MPGLLVPTQDKRLFGSIVLDNHSDAKDAAKFSRQRSVPVGLLRARQPGIPLWPFSLASLAKARLDFIPLVFFGGEGFDIEKDARHPLAPVSFAPGGAWLLGGFVDAAQRLQNGARFIDRFLILGLGLRIGDDASARLDVGRAVF